jgi:hypothetical protein
VADYKETKQTLADVSRHSGMGDHYTAMQNLFYGINHRGTGIPITPNTDHYGLTFFTRPDLNLSYDNINGDDRLKPYLIEDQKDIRRAVRALLDPRGNRGENIGSKNESIFLDKIESKLIDPDLPFISLATNNLMSLSGFPDMVANTFTTTPGIYKEEQSIIDDVSFDYSAYDITANFRNVVGDPITSLFYLWWCYSTMVYAGRLMPYPKNIFKNRIDYNTKVYRLVLDPTRTYVTKMATTIAIPTTVPMGSHFNFDSQRPVTEENNQISINFKCNGINYNRQRDIYEFNRLVGLFDVNMRPSPTGNNSMFNIPNLNDPTAPLAGVVAGKYAKINTDQMSYMNFRGKPRINPLTMELEWYAPVDTFKVQRVNDNPS